MNGTRAITLAFAAVAPFVVAHCGETERDGSSPGGAGGSAGATLGGGGGQPVVDGSTDADADDDQWELKIPDVTGYDGPKYDGDQSCAPEPTGFGAYVSCCEGVPCEGECHLLNGTWQCDCNGISGGCGQYGMHCCKGGCVVTCSGGPGK